MHRHTKAEKSFLLEYQRPVLLTLQKEGIIDRSSWRNVSENLNCNISKVKLHNRSNNIRTFDKCRFCATLTRKGGIIMIQVAAYCRVSTDKEDQANSFETQQRYFREWIDRNPEWMLQEIYADEGISGTNTKKRTQFNRMIRAAREGKIDLIITKEVSRFARNTVDTLEYTRELRKRGIGVLFLNDNINTMDADGELRLTIMSSIAQNERPHDL